jgi:hypothetical protein
MRAPSGLFGRISVQGLLHRRKRFSLRSLAYLYYTRFRPDAPFCEVGGKIYELNFAKMER